MVFDNQFRVFMQKIKNFNKTAIEDSDTLSSDESLKNDTVENNKSDLDEASLSHTFLAVASIIVIVAISALLGVLLARGCANLLDGDRAAFSGITSVNPITSTPTSAWEQGITPELYQSDPEWSERPYGQSTLGVTGSAPLCLTMAYIDLTGDTTLGPINVASYAQEQGYTEAPKSLLTKGAEKLQLCASAVQVDELSLRKAVVSGTPVIAAMHGGDFGEETTYIVLTDIDEYSMLVLVDPNSPERTARRWEFDEVVPYIESMWSYTIAIS